MNGSSPAWSILRQKLKVRYKHLTDADLKDIQSDWRSAQWLETLQRRAGGTPFEIALLVEESTEAGKGWPVSTPLSLRRSVRA